MAKAITHQSAPCVYWPPFSADAWRVGFDIAWIEESLVERRVEQQDKILLAANEKLVHGAIARLAWPGSPAREITLQDCAIESILHSLFAAEPSAV